MANRDHLDMLLKASEAFVEDGTLTGHAFKKIVAIAERDGQFSADETRVLGNILATLDVGEVDGDIKRQLSDLIHRYGLELDLSTD